MQTRGWIGIDINETKLQDLGADILQRKNHFKLREGFDPVAQPIPKRILETISPSEVIPEEFLREALKKFGERIAGIERPS